ncbi:MAG TPA: hypothetical protein DEA55_04305 [Rhodospirillaceae bacterium]|nr:hypothetical protein [Rhodospirillaceae bacterium]
MSNKITFNDAQKEQIRQALSDYLFISDGAAKESFIRSVEQTGTLSAFGAGSLLSYSHLQEADGTFKKDLADKFPGIDQASLVKVTPATLKDYEKDFVCFDIHYRGTPEKPGITIGNEFKKGAETPGGILETKIDHLGADSAANFVCYYLEKFNQREAPPNMPIYKFEVINVESEDGRKVPSIVCVADRASDLYIYNPENRFAKTRPFYQIERGPQGDNIKAFIMAAAYNDKRPDGSQKGPGAITDLDYLRNLINDSMAKGVEVESRFHGLYTSAIRERMKIDPEERMMLEGFEHEGRKGNMPRMLENFMFAISAHNEGVRYRELAIPRSTQPETLAL